MFFDKLPHINQFLLYFLCVYEQFFSFTDDIKEIRVFRSIQELILFVHFNKLQATLTFFIIPSINQKKNGKNNLFEIDKDFDAVEKREIINLM